MFITEINNCDGYHPGNILLLTGVGKKAAKISNVPVISPMPFGKSYTTKICSGIEIMITTQEFLHRCTDKCIEHIQSWH